MKELTKPIKELTLEERRARQRLYMERYLAKIKEDPNKAAEFRSKASKNYKKFYDSVRIRPRRQNAS
jgi:hypothetical protein